MEELAVNRRDELIVADACKPIGIDVLGFFGLREQPLELR